MEKKASDLREFEGILRAKSACTSLLHRPAVQRQDQSPPGRAKKKAERKRETQEGRK
jgi:hypothetical protein